LKTKRNAPGASQDQIDEYNDAIAAAELEFSNINDAELAEVAEAVDAAAEKLGDLADGTTLQPLSGALNGAVDKLNELGQQHQQGSG
jgi:hypothetical protein